MITSGGAIAFMAVALPASGGVQAKVGTAKLQLQVGSCPIYKELKSRIFLYLKEDSAFVSG